MRVLGLDGSPQGHGRTELAVRAVLDGAEQAGAQTELMSLEDFSIDEAIDQVEAADGVILGTPVYRASFAFPLKMFLDHLPRGLGAETRAPLRGKSVAILATGASLHHFLALNDLRNVLCTFFAAHVMPPGLYVSREAFTEDDRLVPDVARQAESQGVAIVELAGALSTSPTLRSLVPQA